MDDSICCSLAATFGETPRSKDDGGEEYGDDEEEEAQKEMTAVKWEEQRKKRSGSESCREFVSAAIESVLNVSYGHCIGNV